jgi:ATP-dependent Lon protease
MDLDYDLSKTMFICTANTLQGIPAPLQDRLEVIHLPGYTEQEKLSIARRYLVPKQMKSNGIGDENFSITRQAVQRIIREYTRESGVRNLEREVATVCRKVAKRIVWKGKETQIRVTSENVDKLLGVPRYSSTRLESEDAVGLVKGLAVTPWGGELLDIEVAVVPGKGKLILTGLLGDWLKESATAGFSYIRSRAESLGLEKDFQEKFDFHVHYPGNSLKTDGPSAGIAMATAMVSALLGRRVRKDIAMTGEITLRGRVLPIGGLKEKTMAAHRSGITRVLVPKQNEKDLQEIPKLVTDKVDIVLVSHLDVVLEYALILGPGETLFDSPPPNEEDSVDTQVDVPAAAARPS